MIVPQLLLYCLLFTAMAWFFTYLGPCIGEEAAVTVFTAYQNDMLPAILPMYVPMVLFSGSILSCRLWARPGISGGCSPFTR